MQSAIGAPAFALRTGGPTPWASPVNSALVEGMGFDPGPRYNNRCTRTRANAKDHS